MISFRVSEPEFELLKGKSDAEGARSISDFVRLVLCGSAMGSTDRVDKGLHQLTGQIQQLSVELRRATELLETSRPASPEARVMSAWSSKSEQQAE